MKGKVAKINVITSLFNNKIRCNKNTKVYKFEYCFIKIGRSYLTKHSKKYNNKTKSILKVLSHISKP